MPSRKIYLVGTDTEIGKTSVAQAMLELARSEGRSALPFKPAQSGQGELEESDAARLANSAGLSLADIPRIAPHRYSEDRAPGCVATDAFTNGHGGSDSSYLHRAKESLHALIEEKSPEWTLIEGAGGLQVPMPGGTWQLDWIRELADWIILVAPVGLGTINHSLLTHQALEAAKQKLLGIAWTGVASTNRALAEENMKVVAQKSGLPRLSSPDWKGGFSLQEKLYPTLLERMKNWPRL